MSQVLRFPATDFDSVGHFWPRSTLIKMRISLTYLLMCYVSLVICSEANEDTLAQSITSFALSHGFSKVNIVVMSRDMSWKSIALKLIQKLTERNVAVAIRSMEDFELQEHKTIKEKFIFLPSVSNIDDWEKILPIITNIQVQSTVVLTSISQEMFPSSNLNSQLYLYNVFNNSWCDITTLVDTGSPIVQRLDLLSLNSLNSFSKPCHDFNNITISTVNLSWEPYIMLKDCDPFGRACHATGFSADIALVTERLLNLHIEFTMEQTGIYGSIPVTREDNSTHWVGITGDLFHKQRHISLVLWYMHPTRSDALDMAWIYPNAVVGVMSPRKSDLDWLLFLRPFTTEVWMISSSLLLLITALSRLSLLFHRGNTKATSFQIAQLSGLLFFVMIDAFYSGALTMFFSDDIQIPFHSVEEVINAYPNWKLLMLNGTEILYEPYITDSVEYRQFWERVQMKPDETIAENEKEALKKVLSEQAVIELDDGVFKYHKGSKEFGGTNLQVAFRSTLASHMAILLADNSPLTSAMEYVFMHMYEHGITTRLKDKWENGAIGENLVDGNNQMTLSLGQVVLIFAIMTVGLFLSLIVMLAELLLKYWSRRSSLRFRK